MERETILSIKETERDNTKYEYKLDISELDSTDFIKQIIYVMRLQGYHDVSIWRALDYNKFEMEEYLDSIKRSDEWKDD